MLNCRSKRDQILSFQSELESFQRSMAKEQETNEKLSLLLNKKQGDLATLKKLILLTQNRFMTLKSEYSAYTRALQETESNLFRAKAVSYLTLRLIIIKICTIILSILLFPM